MTQRPLVLVAGSGRSGTSLLSGILQRLGLHVPQPEVPADATNPKGFAESQWVVDFHTRLLQRSRVQVSDARPAAWAQTAQVALDEEVRGELRAWLADQMRTGAVIVKDPRLSWFLPLWRRCGEDVGASVSFVTMLRQPAAVIDSKQRWYGAWQGDVSRAAGWLNQTLYTERATREAPRAFVRYDDLLDDWTRTVARLADTLDLTVVQDASANDMRRVHEFVDRGLNRSRADWDAFRLPPSLRAQADEVWTLVDGLAGETPPADADQLLDTARAAYVALYEEAEAIAQSSLAAAARPAAARPAAGSLPAPARRVLRRVPERYRHAVPVRLRRGIVRAVTG